MCHTIETDQERSKENMYYVWNLGKKRKNGGRRKTKYYVDPKKGLHKWLERNDVLSRRIRVETPAEFQAMLDEGRCFLLYMFNARRNIWRALIPISSETTRIQGNDLVHNGAAKPFYHSGALNASDELCIDSMIVEVLDTREDLASREAANRHIKAMGRRRDGVNPFVNS